MLEHVHPNEATGLVVGLWVHTKCVRAVFMLSRNRQFWGAYDGCSRTLNAESSRVRALAMEVTCSVYNYNKCFHSPYLSKLETFSNIHFKAKRCHYLYADAHYDSLGARISKFMYVDISSKLCY